MRYILEFSVAIFSFLAFILIASTGTSMMNSDSTIMFVVGIWLVIVGLVVGFSGWNWALKRVLVKSAKKEEEVEQ